MDQENLPREEGLGAMEFFLLALVGKTGLRSVYELRQHASLEPGAMRSAMERLEAAQLISRTEPGKRRRRELALTAEGSFLLEHRWPNCLREYPDADAILRAAFVGWAMAGADAAAMYLRAMASARQQGAGEMSRTATYLKPSKAEALPSYLWMRASQEAHRRSSEGEAFLSMSRSIEESLS